MFKKILSLLVAFVCLAAVAVSITRAFNGLDAGPGYGSGDSSPEFEEDGGYVPIP